jgi:hypothetical protein
VGNLLQQSLDLYNESWQKDHSEVMRKYAHADGLCDVIRFGSNLFDRLEAALREGRTDTCAGVADALTSIGSWYETSSAVISAIEELEQEDYSVELANELRSRHRQAGSILEDLQDASRAIEAVYDGRGVSLAEFLNELRNPVHG